MATSAVDVEALLEGDGIRPGDLVGLALAPGPALAPGTGTGTGTGTGIATANGIASGTATAAASGWGMATAERRLIGTGATEEALTVVARLDAVLRPRWVVWSQDPAVAVRRADGRLSTAWDLTAVHRLLFGGWRADPARIWAQAHGLDPATIPSGAAPDLFSPVLEEAGDPEDPVGPDGHLRPEWAGGGWAASPARLARWAQVAVEVARVQQIALGARPAHPLAMATARSESTAEVLCAELSVDGLPMDRTVAEGILAGLIGPRPVSVADAARIRAARDAEVFRLLPPGPGVDLRSAGQVRALLARVGVDVPDTRAWRLRARREAHPLVDALLAWRKAERIATTYSYAWLDEHLGPDGRLRGEWTGADGAAGRMTASAGLHNMPAEMRPAVRAEAGRVFVRADLGQIEPRVLAAVSGDRALAAAAQADDMYAPVALTLGVDRATAKVAVLGAMYGQTTGHGAQALKGLNAAYPVAMAYLAEAERAARAGQDLRTYGGRRIAMGSEADPARGPEVEARIAARGRYGRNALIQGAAAELFKMWAVTVRARAQPLEAHIVLCLHDEILVHAPVVGSDRVARLLDDCLQEAVRRWAPDDSVRFLAGISVITSWSDGKGAPSPEAYDPAATGGAQP
jgi:DNA polymerase-1